jgi:hypothetical protein
MLSYFGFARKIEANATEASGVRCGLRLLPGLLRFVALGVALLGAKSVFGQETVFNVPSADVLNKGQVYFEQDGTVRPVNVFATFTPRIVVGVGGQIEVGVNFDGLSAPTVGELELSPTIKWLVWKSADSEWTLHVGDDLFFPVRDRTYDAGNYVYAALGKKWKHGTRVTAGAYDFTKNVVATANRAGGQFTVEQTLGSRVTVASEWYTGNTATGYVNTGAVIKVTQKLTGYAAYQLGNAGISKGNHQFLWELGYNFN